MASSYADARKALKSKGGGSKPTNASVATKPPVRKYGGATLGSSTHSTESNSSISNPYGATKLKKTPTTKVPTKMGATSKTTTTTGAAAKWQKEKKELPRDKYGSYSSDDSSDGGEYPPVARRKFPPKRPTTSNATTKTAATSKTTTTTAMKMPRRQDTDSENESKLSNARSGLRSVSRNNSAASTSSELSRKNEGSLANSKAALKSTGAFGAGGSTHSAATNGGSTSTAGGAGAAVITAKAGSLEHAVQRLRKVGALADLATAATPRDNDLVASLLRATANDPAITEIVVNNDPRFAHVPMSTLLDFADGLHLNCYLTKLKITQVELGNGFLSALAGSMHNNMTLEVIDLKQNAFTSDALVDFCTSLKDNQSLRKVDLRNQNAPVNSQQEKAVMAALESNKYIQLFRMDFRSPQCPKFIDMVLKRNTKKVKTIKNRDQKLIEYFEKEATKAEEAYEHRNDAFSNMAERDLADNEYKFFYELDCQAKKYKFDENKTEEEQTDAEKAVMEKKFTIEGMTADGAFLNDEFITQFLVDDEETKSLSFTFTNQSKVFKRFGPTDPARKVIVEKFVQALLRHPRSKSINMVLMSNTCLGDDWLECLCNTCMKTKGLPALHQINVETNFLSDYGLSALGDAIGHDQTWKYLQVVKLDNQKHLLKTAAETSLAEGLAVNRTVIRFSGRIRNLRERDCINKCIQRNLDYLRQARNLHNAAEGIVIERKRNKMERFFDSVAANDDSNITEVNLVGDQLFLALHSSEVMKAATSFATNTYIVSVQMNLLKLDDKFATELAKSLTRNDTIQILELNNNAMSGEGILAIINVLGNNANTSISELQVRHQSKPINSAHEDELADALQGNEGCLVKFGIDLRSTLARTKVDKKIRQNQDKARKQRVERSKSNESVDRMAPGRTNSKQPPSRSGSKIKSVETANLFRKVIQNDKSTTKVILDGDEEFLGMPASDKQAFVQGLAKNTAVTHVALDSLRLDNTFAESLAAVFKTNKTLQSFSANKNDFTSAGVLALSRAAACHCRSMKSFSCLKPRFKITVEHAESLLDEMEKKSYLTEMKIEFRETELTTRLNKILKKNKK